MEHTGQAQVNQKSFKNAIFTLLILSVTIPSIILSGLLIKLFYDHQLQRMHTTVDLRASNLANNLEHELGLVTARLQTLSTNNDLQLSTINPLFSLRANELMETFSQENALIDAMYVFNERGNTREVMPMVAEFVDLPIQPELIEQYYDKVSLSKQTTPQILLLENSQFDEQIREYLVGRQPLTSDAYIVLLVPLLLDELKGAIEGRVRGVLGAMIPVDYIAKAITPNLTETERIDLLSESKSLLESPVILANSETQVTKPIFIQEKQILQLSLSDEYASQFKQVRSQLLLLFFVVAIIFTLFLGGMFLWLRLLVQPLDATVAVVQHFSDGRYDIDESQFTFREFGRIADVLKILSSRILEEQYKLEARVMARTKALEKSNKELHETMDVLQQAQDQLIETEKMSLLGQLVAGVAHEINTPVGISVTAASLSRDSAQAIEQKVEDGTLTKTAHASLLEDIISSNEMVLSNLNRASELISNFKTVAVEQSSLQLRQFCLYEFINEVASSLQHKLKKRNVQLMVQGDEHLTLYGYPGVFSQILTNFIMNSIYHGFEDVASPKITITFFLDETKLFLEYTDNGVGMEETVRDKIFEPFFTTKRGKGGSGLGMHIVYNLVSQTLGGEIMCESQVGEGSTFRIWFTLPDAPKEDELL